jgi:hypothetical protein
VFWLLLDAALLHAQAGLHMCCVVPFLQDAFAPVALQALKQLAGLLPAAAAGTDLERLKSLLSAVRLLCRIFLSLNSPGLTPVRGSSPAVTECGQQLLSQ